jgi:ATPase subunit of ABC transporter with duplicated ATPase domains
VLVANNITMQFGAKPLFENVSVKFGEGYRYGLIGANGSGKSTFMKILAGELEPTAGNVSKDAHERMAYLRQDQFAFEQQRVIDVVMMGHEEMWACMLEKDAIYANPEASEDDYMHAADLEARFAEYGGYTAEARAGELLLGVGIPAEQHFGPMSDVAPGWKLRVLLIQALFADPDILLLDEPTNNLDIATIRWLENVINERNSTMVIISHDRHFLNQVCTHMADLDYGKITVYPGNYDDFMEASTQARERQQSANAKAKERIAELQNFVRRFSANASKAKQATSRLKLIDKLKPEDVKPSSRQYPWIRFEFDEKEKLHRQAVEIQNLSFAYHGQRAKDLQQARPDAQRRRPAGDHRRKRRRQDDAAEAADGRVAAAARQHQVGRERRAPVTTRRTTPGFRQRRQPDRLDRRLRAQQRERRRRPRR